MHNGKRNQRDHYCMQDIEGPRRLCSTNAEKDLGVIFEQNLI